MTHNTDIASGSSTAVIEALGKRLDQIRLSQNISQADLAAEAGVSRSTLTRLAHGKAVSLDSFVRVMLALGLGEHLAALLPDPGVRPVERVRRAGTERRRASGTRSPAPAWRWGDQESES